MLATFVYDKIAVSYLGSNGSKYFPFILYVFYVILFGNLFGLIPGVFSITSNLSFTLYMSSIC
jgi:F-type H+-transporting ATPase subunit a